MSSQRTSSNNIAPANRVPHLVGSVIVNRSAGIVAVGASA